MKTISVSASKTYDVCIGSGLMTELGQRTAKVVRGRRCMVVSDTNVAPLYMDNALASLKEAGFDAASFVFPAGEASKNGETYLALVNTLAEAKLTRADVLIALGGGVVGDLTGFAAATFLRGIACVQVPTTLLSCVDSSVGGKTAIDLPAGKNLCGAFYQPNLVLCDPEVLRTLPEEILADGCAEVIKYGMLGDADLLQKLQDTHITDQMEDAIARCVEMKRDIVENDEFDTGKRQLLNLGHTFAHSIEALSHYGTSHGSAVAMGMVLVTRAAVKRGICPAECLDVLLSLLKKYKLPAETPYTAEDLASIALSDKKRSGDMLNLVLPCGMGDSKLNPVNVSELQTWAADGLQA